MKEYMRDGRTLEESKYFHIETKEVPNEDGTVTFVKQKVCHYEAPPIFRYVNGKSASKYIAKEDGVYEQWEDLDQFGKPMQAVEKLVMTKEAFMVAYNAYIKGGE